MALTPRSQQLQNMAKQYPAANKQNAQNLANANTMQLMQAAGQQGQAKQPATQQQAQAVGGAIAQQNAAQATQKQAQGMQQQGQIAQMGIQDQQMQNRKDLATRALDLSRQNREMQQQLSSMNQEYGNKLFNDNMQFQQDEIGRTVWNNRQLLDWAASKAKSEEELANYEQIVSQIVQRKHQLHQAASARIQQELESIAAKSDQSADQEHKKQLYEARAALNKKLAEDAAEAQNTAAMWSTVGTILGGIAGAAGGPAGVMVGASIGGGLGTMAAGATAKKNPGR